MDRWCGRGQGESRSCDRSRFLLARIDSSEKKRARWRTGLEISFLVSRSGRIFPKKFLVKRGLRAKDAEKARNVIRWNYRET